VNSLFQGFAESSLEGVDELSEQYLQTRASFFSGFSACFHLFVLVLSIKKDKGSIFDRLSKEIVEFFKKEGVR
jgi:hypothetical protein